MWSRLTALLLSIVTALFNNLGFWQQEETYYDNDYKYEIAADSVDYGNLDEWYTSLYGNSAASCTVEAKSHASKTNVRGVGYIIAGAEMNPDAQLVFSDEDVIIAPGKCRVQSSPESSASRIVVSNGEKGADGFKMEIENPKRWFCCENVQPTVTGQFFHKQEDHKIELKQGDTICVASSDTKVTLYRGEGRDGELKRCDLRTFLRATDNEAGSSDVNANGNAEQIITNAQGKGDAWCQANIKDSEIFQGPSGWQYDGKGWWWGRSGVAGVDYAVNKYIVYEYMYYKFNNDGYMITGWNDGYYFSESAEQRGNFKQGAMCFNAIVQSPTDSSRYVYVGYNGKVQDGGASREYEGVNYVYDSGSQTYYKSSAVTSEIASGNSSGNSNNGTGQNISQQEKENTSSGTLSSEQFNQITKDKMILDENMSGWYSYGNKWVLLESGSPMEATSDKRYAVDGIGQTYAVDYEGTTYLFSTQDDVLVTGGRDGQQQTYASSGSDWYVIDGDRGILKGQWRLDNAGRWIYAGTDGVLLRKDNFGSGIFPDPSGVSGRYYAFDSNCYLDTTTEVLVAEHYLSTHEYYLDGVVVGSRSERLTTR